MSKSTGRLSSKDPGQQTIPVPTVVASPGKSSYHDFQSAGKVGDFLVNYGTRYIAQDYFPPSSYRSAQEQLDKFKERYGVVFSGATPEDRKAAGRILEDGLVAGKGIKVEKRNAGDIRVSLDYDVIDAAVGALQESLGAAHRRILVQDEIIAELRELVADLMAAVFEDAS